MLIAATAVVGLALVLGGAGYVVTQTLRPATVTPNLFLDLSGAWGVVDAQASDSEAPPTIALPRVVDSYAPTPWSRWSSYRRTFETPSICTTVDCSMLMGGFLSAAAMSINGVEVTQDALLPPARHKGREFYLTAPLKDYLRPPGEINTLELKVFGDNGAYFGGPIAGPMGIVKSSVGAKYQTAQRFTQSAFSLAMAVAFAFIATVLVVLGATWKLQHRAFGLFTVYCLCHVAFFAVSADRSNLFVSPIWGVVFGYVLGGRAVDVTLFGLAYACLPEQLARRGFFRVLFRAVCWPAALASGVVVGIACARPTGMHAPSVALTVSEPYWIYKLTLNAALACWCLFDKKISERHHVVCALVLLIVYNGALLIPLPFGGCVHRAYCFALACFFAMIALRRAYRAAVLREEAVRRDADAGKKARQIAHDIRSPLAALAIASREMTGLEEGARLLLRGAVDRINDIANHLLKGPSDGKRDVCDDVSPRLVSLVPVVDALVSEARARHRNKRLIRFETCLDHRSYGAFVKAGEADLCRAITNLINNAAEAADGPCAVTVSVIAAEGRATVNISDTGRGMPAHVLANLGQRGFTCGKVDGHGLGTSQAMDFAQQNGGRVHYQSVLGEGTTAALILEAVAPPAWYPKSIQVRADQAVVIVDDDPSIHSLWERRFKGHTADSAPMALLHFTNAEEFKAAAIPAGAVFLVDCELIGSKDSGLDLIAALPVRHAAYLVTSHAEESSVQATCAQLGCKLLSKSAAALAPIQTIAGRPTQKALPKRCAWGRLECFAPLALRGRRHRNPRRRAHRAPR